ncbi:MULTISPECIES: hypothetical protein [unclassified Devosia]|jgi:hypothetical protein|nr:MULTISPECIES: hypothetical protein [unclassified Devosia]
MKYDGDLFFASALPDAPLPMPKQQLERRRSLFQALRNAITAFSWL